MEPWETARLGGRRPARVHWRNSPLPAISAALRVPRERVVHYWTSLADVCDPGDTAPAYFARAVATLARLDAGHRELDPTNATAWARDVSRQGHEAITILRLHWAGARRAKVLGHWLRVAPITELSGFTDESNCERQLSSFAPMTNGLIQTITQDYEQDFRLGEDLSGNVAAMARKLWKGESLDGWSHAVRGTGRARTVTAKQQQRRHLTDEEWLLETHGVGWHTGGQ